MSAFLGFGYDFSRFVRYAGWRGHADCHKRDYKAVQTYHRLEKRLSFRPRRSGSGWSAAGDFVHLLSRVRASSTLGYHETVGIKVLRDFGAMS